MGCINNAVASVASKTVYPGMKDEVKTALMRSSLESNWSTNKPLGLHNSCVTATKVKP